jgi:hypothetical protein
MSSAVPPLTLHPLMEWAGAILPLPLPLPFAFTFTLFLPLPLPLNHVYA